MVRGDTPSPWYGKMPPWHASGDGALQGSESYARFGWPGPTAELIFLTPRPS